MRRVRFDARKSSLGSLPEASDPYNRNAVFKKKQQVNTYLHFAPPSEKNFPWRLLFPRKKKKLKSYSVKKLYMITLWLSEKKNETPPPPLPFLFKESNKRPPRVLDDDEVFSYMYLLSQTITTCLSRALVSCCFQEWWDTCTSLFVPSMAATSKPLVHSRWNTEQLQRGKKKKGELDPVHKHIVLVYVYVLCHT